ncbi:MAG TPA: hypothetical protein PK406_15465, partial [Verrucomicrobiota bacterium]|nr:hypothetical protein [Verrucomicrobiota bacterium]
GRLEIESLFENPFGAGPGLQRRAIAVVSWPRALTRRGVRLFKQTPRDAATLSPQPPGDGWTKTYPTRILWPHEYDDKHPKATGV